MAAKCPLCHSPISDDFGLGECANCGAQLIIHMDGKVEYSGAETAREESIEPVAEIPPEAPAEPEQEFDFAEGPREFDYQTSAKPPPAPVEEEVQRSQAAYLVAPGDPLVDEPDIFDEQLANAVAEDSVPEPDTPPPAPKLAGDSPDLSDIAGFGNADMSLGRDGPLRYNLVITGIDTADVRQAFREALTDRKFMWDQDQILRTLKRGKVRINNVSPAKAYMLITRLRSLPVDVTWEQHAVTQT